MSDSGQETDKESSKLIMRTSAGTPGSSRAEATNLMERLDFGPDWRWRLAGQVYRGDARTRDPLVMEAAAYLKVRHNPKACQKYQRIALLERMYATPHPRAARWFVEALLIAGADDDEIAGHTGLPPWFIALYHDLFYDVRPHRQFAVAMLSAAMQRLDSYAEFDAGWKRLGFECGVEALVAFWTGNGSQVTRDRLDRWLVGAMQRAALTAASQRLRHVDPENVGEAIGQYLAKAAMDSGVGKGPDPRPLEALELRIVPKTTQAAEPIYIPEVSLVRRLQGGGSQDAPERNGLDTIERETKGSG